MKYVTRRLKCTDILTPNLGTMEVKTPEVIAAAPIGSIQACKG